MTNTNALPIEISTTIGLALDILHEMGSDYEVIRESRARRLGKPKLVLGMSEADFESAASEAARFIKEIDGNHFLSGTHNPDYVLQGFECLNKDYFDITYAP